MIGTPHPGSQIQAPQSGGDTIFARLREKKGLVAWSGLGAEAVARFDPEFRPGNAG